VTAISRIAKPFHAEIESWDYPPTVIALVVVVVIASFAFSMGPLARGDPGALSARRRAGARRGGRVIRAWGTLYGHDA
jgi:hypothetical protein